uniref:Uncharacterized protein n=1 Tax=Anguilla anguilla TaxID=7936 RepID=A0A0E9WCW5_ANGAN
MQPFILDFEGCESCHLNAKEKDNGKKAPLYQCVCTQSEEQLRIKCSQVQLQQNTKS